MMSIVRPDTAIPFLNARYVAAAASAVFIVVGLVMFGVRGQENFGVDFREGTNMNLVLENDEDVPVESVRAALAAAGFDSPIVQETASEGGESPNEFLIRVGDVDFATEAPVGAADVTPAPEAAEEVPAAEPAAEDEAAPEAPESPAEGTTVKETGDAPVPPVGEYEGEAPPAASGEAENKNEGGQESAKEAETPAEEAAETGGAAEAPTEEAPDVADVPEAPAEEDVAPMEALEETAEQAAESGAEVVEDAAAADAAPADPVEALAEEGAEGGDVAAETAPAEEEAPAEPTEEAAPAEEAQPAEEEAAPAEEAAPEEEAAAPAEEAEEETEAGLTGLTTVSDRIQGALAPLTALGTVDAVRVIDEQTVGPAVGAQLRRDAIIAVLFALVCIVLYVTFRFELKFAVGAVAALMHDVLITLGIFAIFGREITMPVVAALLTIIGYSLNDTIVVFDRIREDMQLYRGRGYKFIEVLNLSINQTLSRTLLTSLTTMFVVLVLYLFGGSAINNFAFALIIGVIVGTYSSVFIAGATVNLWQEIQGRAKPAEETKGVTTKGSKKGKKKAKGGAAS